MQARSNDVISTQFLEKDPKALQTNLLNSLFIIDCECTSGVYYKVSVQGGLRKNLLWFCPFYLRFSSIYSGFCNFLLYFLPFLSDLNYWEMQRRPAHNNLGLFFSDTWSHLSSGFRPERDWLILAAVAPMDQTQSSPGDKCDQSASEKAPTELLGAPLTPSPLPENCTTLSRRHGLHVCCLSWWLLAGVRVFKYNLSPRSHPLMTFHCETFSLIDSNPSNV